MPRQKDDLSRAVFLDVCANGSVHVREPGQKMQDGLLPVFTVDTVEQADKLRVRFCRLARDGSGLMFLNDPPSDVSDLARVSDLFRAEYRRLTA